MLRPVLGQPWEDIMVMAREYMEHFLQPGVEKEVKAAIRTAGGSYN